MKGVEVGNIIAYKLRLADRPKQTDRLWRGLVVHVYQDCYLVKSLEEGYNGMLELVFFNQIELKKVKEYAAG